MGSDRKEVRLKIGTGYLCFESFDQNPDGTGYVRVLDKDGTEIVYWDAAEWAAHPAGVMGAIMGAIHAIHSGRVSFAPETGRIQQEKL